MGASSFFAANAIHQSFRLLRYTDPLSCRCPHVPDIFAHQILPIREQGQREVIESIHQAEGAPCFIFRLYVEGCEWGKTAHIPG